MSDFKLPDPNDDWAMVELHRWQYGELPRPTDMRPLNVSEGLRKMADAIQAGCQKDATPRQREDMPSPFNVCSVMRYVAKLTEVELPGASPRGQKVGRNDSCPCGSGKKFKHCCIDAIVSDGNRRLLCLASIRETVEGHVDGAPDRSDVASLANHVMYDLEALTTGLPFFNPTAKAKGAK